ncbi:9156_t:CDS:2 [Diversispora eburnea]|uniref:non-specific serine/threonine protein kinase n=1 Tax=Diversispora eburnea TaxID=1213867 RepID=A0A9N9B933_9GLOM|nr:9156_t:CDS:2 [Diversispora eburnea]
MFNFEPVDKEKPTKHPKDLIVSSEPERSDQSSHAKKVHDIRRPQSADARISQNPTTNSNFPKPRFQKVFSSHVHNLSPNKKISRMHNIWKGVGIHNQFENKQIEERNERPPVLKHSKSEVSLSEKYGKPQEIIGRGTFGVVRVSHKIEPKVPGERLYAKYIKRLTSEFCISSSLHHINVIDTLDLLQDTQGNYCEIMEFCAGGDLYSFIASSGGLEKGEADCFFGQLINGVKYLHDNGVAHRDLKPENLLLTSAGCLKISDFGNGECFRMAWETQAHLSHGICGSEPYIAPEEFTEDWFDPRLVDVWACGIIYMGMIMGRHLWKIAKAEDSNFKIYLEARTHGVYLEPFQKLSIGVRRVMSMVIEPNPKHRATIEQIINDPWFSMIDICFKSSPSSNSITTNLACGVKCNEKQKTMNKPPIANLV